MYEFLSISCDSFKNTLLAPLCEVQFEVILIFAPIQQEAKHDQEKISAEQK